MKFFLLLALLFVSCSEYDLKNSTNNNFDTIVIDSCEYLRYDSGVFETRVYSITHKGNCKYCLERSKK
jgi:hypothetical protein